MDTTNLFRLDGRVALVTGGSRGIGKMIAAGFVAQGAKVYISSRKADACFETVDRTRRKLPIALPQDVSTVAGCKALAAQFAEHESRNSTSSSTMPARHGASRSRTSPKKAGTR